MIVTSSVFVPSPGYNDWVVERVENSDAGTVVYNIYGSSGRLLSSTDASTVIAHYEGLIAQGSESTATYQGVLAELKSMSAGDPPPTAKSNTAGVQSLADLNDTKKLADPSATAGLTGDVSTVGNKLADLGSTGFSPNKLASTFASGAIKLPSIPHLDSFAGGLAAAVKNSAPTIAGVVAGAEGVVGGLVKGVKGELSGLMGGLASAINSMTGKGSGTLGVPSLNDVMGPVTGQSPAMRAAMLNPTDPASVAAITAAVNNANSFFATAGIDLTAPKPNGLKSCMNFASNLHGLGADTGGFGTANMLAAMATADQFGDAIKASVQEGKNNAVLNSAAGVPPPVHDAPTTYTADRAALEKQETDLVTSYDDSDLLTDKLDNVQKSVAIRNQIYVLDQQYGNDPDMVTTDGSTIDSYNAQIAALRAQIAAGNTT